MAITCQACGSEVDESSVYCPKCGGRIDTPAAADSSFAAETPDEPSVEPPIEESPQPAANNPETVAQRLREAGAGTGVREEVESWSGGYATKAMIGTWCIDLLITVAVLAPTIWLARRDWRWTQWAGSFTFWAIVIGGLLLLWGYHALLLLYRRASIRYRLTSLRFMHEKGILRHVVDCIEVIDIDDVKFEQKLWERIVGVGTLHITSSDRSHPELEMAGIANPKEVFAKFDKARREERMRRGLHIEQI